MKKNYNIPEKLIFNFFKSTNKADKTYFSIY